MLTNVRLFKAVIMINQESLPFGTFSTSDISYINMLEEQMRPKDNIKSLEQQTRQNNPERYYKIAKVAGRLAPGDLGLRSFYFVEFLLDPNLLEIIPSHDDHDA